MITTPQQAGSVTLAATDGRIELTLEDAAELSVTLALTPQAAGALAGQLITAAHQPLPTDFTVTGIPQTAGSDRRPCDQKPQRTNVPVTPALIATQVNQRSSTATGRPEPVSSTLAWSSTAPGDVLDKPWRLTQSATEQLNSHGLTREGVIAIAQDPETVVPAAYGGGHNHLRGGIGALIPPDDPRLIIAVFREDRSGAPSKPRGGPGRRMPGTHAELRAMLLEHGFTVDSSKAHPKATHPDLDTPVVLPATPSDHRSLANLLAEIRRQSGIDITIKP